LPIKICPVSSIVVPIPPLFTGKTPVEIFSKIKLLILEPSPINDVALIVPLTSKLKRGIVEPIPKLGLIQTKLVD
jgi:hypothetical protein